MAHGPNMPAPVALPGVSKIVAIGSGKGGVGKTTVAVNLAIALSRLGQRVVPNLTHGIKTISIGYISPGDKPLVMRGPMLHQIIRQFIQQVEWGELDYLIVDLPPGTGDVVISLVQTVPLTGAVIVSTPSDVSLQDARKALEMFAQVNIEVLGIVENMSHFTCPHCHHEIDIFSRGGAERTAQQFNVPFLGAIELIPSIREGGDRGLPVALAGPKSPQAAEFYGVAEKLMLRAEAAAAAATDVIEIS
jgi:ATP-binding protein involved in chromosome partitioning